MNKKDLENISYLSKQAINDLLNSIKAVSGDIIVVGCSTSEVLGKNIGTASAIDIASSIIDGILPQIEEKQLCLAAQCCEHLNRALVIEEDCAKKNNYEIVSVVPQLKAGGAFATEYFRRCVEPVVVESISAIAGLDIGDTFIGMHIKSVVIPVRGSVKEIGYGHVSMARRRPKLIGGKRSVYTKYI